MKASGLPEGLNPETLNCLSVHLMHETSMKREDAHARVVEVWGEMLGRARASCSELKAFQVRLDEQIKRTRPTSHFSDISENYSAAAEAAEACADHFGEDVRVLDCIRPGDALETLCDWWEVVCTPLPATPPHLHFCLWSLQSGRRGRESQGGSVSDRLTWREAANEARDSAHAYRGMMDDAVARWRDLVMRCDAAAQVLTLADRGHLKLTPAAAVEEARGEAPEQPGGVRSGTLRARQLRLCEVMFERIVVEAEDGRRMIQWEARTEWRPEAGKRPADLFRAIAVAEGKPQEKWDNIRRYFDNVVDKVPEAFPGGLPGRDDLQGWWRLGMTWSSQFTE